MDYIKAIKSFMLWKLSNDLSPKEISLYEAILFVANQSYWKEEFCAPNSTLQALSGIGGGTALKRARDILLKKGLIKYTNGTRHKAGKYRLLPLFANESAIQGGIQNGIRGGIQGGNINNNKIDKLNNGGNKRVKRARASTPPCNVKVKGLAAKEANGQFNNVFLSSEEFLNLKSRYGSNDAGSIIERLSEYMESTGKEYKNHYATLCSWLERDAQKRAAKPLPQQQGRYEKSMSAILGFMQEQEAN